MENSLRSVFGLAKLSGFWVRGFLSEIAGELQTTFVGHEKLVETCVDGICVSAIMSGWRPFYPVWDHKTERSEFSIQNSQNAFYSLVIEF